MVVEHEVRKPMNEVRDRRDRDRAQARSAWLNYVSMSVVICRSLLTTKVLSTLEYMGKRLDIVTSTTQSSDQFQQALARIQEVAAECMPQTHAAAPTPMPRRTTSGPSAFTPLFKLQPTKTLDLPVALQDALRHAGISFHHESIEALQDSLIQAQLERDQKLRDHYDSTSTTTHDTLAQRSRKADEDLNTLLSALYKHTPFQQVSLTNPKLDEQLKSTERELERGERDLVEAEGNEVSLDDPKVRAFIAKYGK